LARRLTTPGEGWVAFGSRGRRGWSCQGRRAACRKRRAWCIWGGQGLYSQRNKRWERPALAAGQRFGVTIAFTGQATPADRDELAEALQVMGLLGGLGARSRRGWGSVRLLSLARDGEEQLGAKFGSVEGLRATMGPLLGRAQAMAEEPPYSAFWRGTRIVAVEGRSDDAVEVLEELGKEMVRFRAFGQTARGSQTVLGEAAEQNFVDDHDAMQAAARAQGVAGVPRRAVFGLPHNYFFSSGAGKIDVGTSSARMDRRASPLLLHAHGVEAGRAVGVLTFFPARFLPPEVQVKVGKGAGGQRAPRPSPELWEPIHGYLGRFLDPASRPSRATPLNLEAGVELAALAAQEHR